jgi:uncharacterized protein (TIGR00255 family)
MKSMTGYGWAEEQDEEVSASAEIKGYNNRFLDIVVYLPPFLSALEIPIREYLAAHCRRGRLEISIRYKEFNAPLVVSLNREAAKAYWKAAEETAKLLGTNEQPGLELILSMEGVLETERARNAEKAEGRIMPLLAKAFEDFDADRKREGEHTYRDILSHVETLEQSRERIASHSDELETIFKENIKARFEELLGDRIDENRILAETAVLLVKYTISEELSRIKAHLAEFRAEAEQTPSPGKKLDFLCQEINREINTIGSKAAVLDVSRETVTMKNALENIREQLRNVE